MIQYGVPTDQPHHHETFIKLIEDMRGDSNVGSPGLADVLTRLVVAAPGETTRADVGRGDMLVPPPASASTPNRRRSISLAKPRQLSPSKVSRAIAAMELANLVEDAAHTTHTSVGRPTGSIRLNRDHFGLLGLKVVSSHEHPTQIHGVITRLDGTVLISEPSDSLPDKADLIEALATHAERLMKSLAAVDKGWARTILGVGVDVPGPVVDGRLISATHVGVHAGETVDVQRPLQKRLAGNMPVVVDNDVNLMAVTETYRPRYPERDLAVIAVLHEGIGAALTLRGLVYRGGAGKAGEIGHQSVALDINPPPHLNLDAQATDRIRSTFGSPCSCGGLEHVDVYAVPARLEQLLDLPFDAAAALPSETDTGVTLAGWGFAIAGRALGSAVASLVNVVNPSRVILVLPPVLAEAPMFGPTAASRFRRTYEEVLTTQSLATGALEARADAESLTVESLKRESVPEEGARNAAIRVLDEFLLHAREEDGCADTWE